MSTYKIWSQLSSTPYKRLAASTSHEQIAQICRPDSASLPLRRRRFDDAPDWRGGDGERWLALFVLVRTTGDFEPSIELRLRDRDVAERGDGVRLN